MKKRSIILIIILISTALIGLMVIQVYWIKNAITVEEANFVRSVNDAVSKVIYKIEKNEMEREFQRRMQNPGNRYSIYDYFDSINRNFDNGIGQFDSREDFEEFINRTFFTQNMIQDWLSTNQPRPIEQRISMPELDSLLTSELEMKGIDTEFEYGIFNPSGNRLIFQRTGKYPRELLNKSFVFTLFPGEIQTDPNYLMVYFPREKQFLISQLWVLLSISIILILLIIFSFTVSVNTIFRQKRLSEMKSDFVNNMTHEFKTPISTIALACEALSDKDIKKSYNVYNSYINIIHEENKRLEGIAEKVLQSAIIEKGQLTLKKDWVNIHEIISNAVEKVCLKIEKRNGEIITNLNAETSVILADKMHITNTIFNLLDNAVKYTLNVPKIEISTHDNESGVYIDVKDNGIGISKSDQQKIFEKLYRIPTGNIHNFKGFGLGLNYVKAVVDKHNGKIELESELKKGSKFTIFLPIEEYKT